MAKSRARWSQPYSLAPHWVHIQIELTLLWLSMELNQLANLTATEKEAALATSRDLFASLFLLNSDKRRYVLCTPHPGHCE